MMSIVAQLTNLYCQDTKEPPVEQDAEHLSVKISLVNIRASLDDDLTYQWCCTVEIDSVHLESSGRKENYTYISAIFGGIGGRPAGGPGGVPAGGGA
jgi:hypothetical protein